VHTLWYDLQVGPSHSTFFFRGEGAKEAAVVNASTIPDILVRFPNSSVLRCHIESEMSPHVLSCRGMFAFAQSSNAFSQIFAVTQTAGHPEVVFYVAGVLQLINSEWLIPRLWPPPKVK